MNRLRLGSAICGFVLALFGVILNDDRLVWGAIAVLAASLILRLIFRRASPKADT